MFFHVATYFWIKCWWNILRPHVSSRNSRHEQTVATTEAIRDQLGAQTTPTVMMVTVT